MKPPPWSIPLEWGLALGFVAALSPFFFQPELDLHISRAFYEPKAVDVPEPGWPLARSQPWAFLYDWGPKPAAILAALGLLAAAGGALSRKLWPWWRPGLFVFLSLVIGPGLIVNSVFKDHFGRPRPRQVQEFGGHLHYHRLLEAGEPGVGRGFPSGHASMGYLWMLGYFLFRHRDGRLAWGFVIGGIAFGLALGLARIVQGGHFASDVLASGLFVWLSGLALAAFLRPDWPNLADTPPASEG